MAKKTVAKKTDDKSFKSKQEEAKSKQGFQTKPLTCSNCAKFASKIEKKKGYFGPYDHESFMRCKLGDFKVGKTNTCKMHQAAK